MLDQLDEVYVKEHGKSIFSEVGLKWFDPAVGIGNFPVVVYQRLMKGLQIPSEEERRQHILEEMIYASELTPKNVFIYKKIFCGDKYKLNMYEGDTLKMDVKKEFKLPSEFVGFDVVMGNPPYNAHGTKHIGNKNIYVYFSKIALTSWLKLNGYLLFIHPPVYRIPHHKIQHTQTNLNEIYTSKKIVCIKMYSIEETHKLMSVMINVDFVIIKNEINNLTYKSKIIDTQQIEYEIIIKPNDFIPNFGLNIMEKIKNKSINGNIELKLDSEIHTQKTTGIKYKNIHGIILKGIKICMSDKKHKYFDTPKLIINGIGSYNYVFYDVEGEYGMSEKAIAILNPSQNTLQFIQSPLFHYIASSTKIIGNNFNIKTSTFLPIIPQDVKINDVNDLYNYFNFTQTEISMVNKVSIPIYKNQYLSCDGKMLLNGNVIPKIKEEIGEDEIHNEDDGEVVEVQTPKKSPIKLDKKIELIPATEAKEEISIPSPIPKKKRTIKKRPKLKVVESSSEDKVVVENPNDSVIEPLFNPSTGRYIKNTPANRKKIQRQTLKRGGKRKKGTRKRQ